MNNFKIVSGRQHEDQIIREKHAGVSVYKEDECFYKIHLNIFPNITYFMRKNANNDGFTIFSKVFGKGKDIKLIRPVGQGRVLQNLKTHMMLYFEALDTTLYMSLFPQD